MPSGMKKSTCPKDGKAATGRGVTRRKAASCSRRCTAPEPRSAPNPILFTPAEGRECACEVVARAVRAGVHRHLGPRARSPPPPAQPEEPPT